MSISSRLPFSFANCEFSAFNWWVPLGGPDLNGSYGVAGCLPLTSATGTLTSDTTNVADGATVVIGRTTYRFKNTLSAAFDVKIGADAAHSLDNLKAAVNCTGTAGTEYFAGTTKNTDAEATTNTDTVQTFQALQPGPPGNLVVLTGATHLTASAATLTGGQAGALQTTREGGIIVNTQAAGVNGYAKDLQVKTSAGRLNTITIYNKSASTIFVQVHNVTSTPSDGAVPYAAPIPVPATTLATFDLPIEFTTGIYICGSSTADTKTLIGSSDLWITANYR